MIIYKITNLLNGKVYIGLTTTSLQKRWVAHLAMSGKNERHLYRAMSKYGKDNFIIEPIDKAKTIEELGEKERYYITLYDSTNQDKGYNMTGGGEHNQLDANPKAKLTIDDVIHIREIYLESKLTCKEAYEFYKDKIKYKPFEKCWEGKSWSSIMPEVFSDETRELHLKMKSRKGQNNGNSKYTSEEIMEIRKYYEIHTFDETFKKYSKSPHKSVFNKVIKRSYLDLPLSDAKPYRRLNKPRGPYKKKIV